MCGCVRVAVRLCEGLRSCTAGGAGLEIVSADSLQVYIGLDIATAKVTAEERSRVTHHMMR